MISSSLSDTVPRMIYKSSRRGFGVIILPNLSMVNCMVTPFIASIVNQLVKLNAKTERNRGQDAVYPSLIEVVIFFEICIPHTHALRCQALPPIH